MDSVLVSKIPTNSEEDMFAPLDETIPKLFVHRYETLVVQMAVVRMP